MLAQSDVNRRGVQIDRGNDAGLRGDRAKPGLSPVAGISDKQALPVDEIAPVARLGPDRRAPLRSRAFAAVQPFAIWAFLWTVGYFVGRSLPRIDPRWELPANLVGGIVAILFIWWATAADGDRTLTLRIAWPPRWSAIPLGLHGVALAYVLVLPLTAALAEHFEKRDSADLASIPGWLMLPEALSIGLWEELLPAVALAPRWPAAA